MLGSETIARLKRWRGEKTPTTAKTPSKTPPKLMPYVSDEFLKWLDELTPPVIVPFSGHLTSEDALRQISYANGALWLRKQIKTESDRTRASADKMKF